MPESHLIPYRYPRSAARSRRAQVLIDGAPITVLATGGGEVATCAVSGPVEVEVRMDRPTSGAVIRPLRCGLTADASGTVLRFRLPGPMRIAIDVPGGPEVFLFADPPEERIPEGPQVRRFTAGQVYEVGELSLADGETVWIEGGAVVRGCLRAHGARGITLCGRGVFDGSYYLDANDRRRFLVFDRCQDITLRDVLLINAPLWQVVFGNCQDVRVSGLKEVGHAGSSDGIDVVGSSRVLIEDCFLRCGDDAIVIKSVDLTTHPQPEPFMWAGDVEDVEVRRCTILAYGGAAFEIGHELQADRVRNLRFRDCDVLGTHHFGCTFSIRNADRACIEDVLYEDIRVEHAYKAFIDLRIIKSMWGRDPERGHVRRVRFRNIDWKRTRFNPGYTTSLIGGWSPEHLVEDVTFENIRIDGVPITSLDELELHTRHATGLRLV